MRRAGDRIFGHSDFGCKKPRDKIAINAGGSGNDAQAIEAHKGADIRLKIADCLLGIENRQIIAGFGGCCWSGPKPLE